MNPRHILTALLVALGLMANVAQGAAEAETVPASDRNRLFEEANQLYEAKEYEKARAIYSKLAQGHLSRELFYNLGNTEFRLGRVGQACLWYRRALFLDPQMVEAGQNLGLLQTKLGFLRFNQSGVDRVVGWMAGNQWLYVAVAGGWIFALGLAALFVLRPRQAIGGVVIAVTVCGLIIAVLASTASVLNHRQLDPGKLAIVVEQEVTALTAPFPDAKPVMELPPGTEVKIAANRQNWVSIYIPGEKAGWVRSSSIEPLWPYQARP